MVLLVSGTGCVLSVTSDLALLAVASGGVNDSCDVRGGLDGREGGQQWS